MAAAQDSIVSSSDFGASSRGIVSAGGVAQERHATVGFFDRATTATSSFGLDDRRCCQHETPFGRLSGRPSSNLASRHNSASAAPIARSPNPERHSESDLQVNRSDLESPIGENPIDTVSALHEAGPLNIPTGFLERTKQAVGVEGSIASICPPLWRLYSPLLNPLRKPRTCATVSAAPDDQLRRVSQQRATCRGPSLRARHLTACLTRMTRHGTQHALQRWN